MRYAKGFFIASFALELVRRGCRLPFRVPLEGDDVAALGDAEAPGFNLGAKLGVVQEGIGVIEVDEVDLAERVRETSAEDRPRLSIQ